MITKLDQKFEEKLEEAQQIYDTHKIDEEDFRDFKAKRLTHRKHTELQNAELGEEMEIEREFGVNMKGAVSKYGEKRKAKYKFTDDGIQITPFSMKQEFGSHEVDEFGNILRKQARGEEDEWLASVEGTLKELEMKEAQEEEQSDKEEVQEKEEEDDDQEEKEEEEGDGFKKPLPVSSQRKISLQKFKLSQYLLPREKLKEALKRLTKEKAKIAEISELISSITSEDCLEGASIYDQKKEDLAFDVEQEKLLEEKRKNELEERKKHIAYRIKWKKKKQSQGTNQKPFFGPFPISKIEEWERQGYFEKNEEKEVEFITAQGLLQKEQIWTSELNKLI